MDEVVEQAVKARDELEARLRLDQSLFQSKVNGIYCMILRLLLLVLFTLGLLVGNFFASLIIGQASPNNSRSPQMRVAKAKEAKKLFKQGCAKCHGSDGAGKTTYGQIVGATDLTDPEWQRQVDDKELINSITYGLGQMPAFDMKLTNEQILSLASYVRSLGR